MNLRKDHFSEMDHHYQQQQTPIISIDVGGIFLMDILINESDPSSPTPSASSSYSSPTNNHQYEYNNSRNKFNHHPEYHDRFLNNNNFYKNNSDRVRRTNNAVAHGYSDGAAGVYFNSKYAQRDLEDGKLSYHYHPYKLGYTEQANSAQMNYHDNRYHQENMIAPAQQQNIKFTSRRLFDQFGDENQEDEAVDEEDQELSNIYWQPEYLGSSLDRLANVINNCDEQYQYGTGNNRAYMKPSNKLHNFEDFDEGFAAGSSSDASCSSASSSFSSCSEEDEEEDGCC